MRTAALGCPAERSSAASCPRNILLHHRMGSLLFFAFSWWGILLQAFAIIHFIRRRPDTFWLWIILIGGWLGALVYIAVEGHSRCRPVAPVVQGLSRAASVSANWKPAILDNPSAGNYEELADLYLGGRAFAGPANPTTRRFPPAPILPTRSTAAAVPPSRWATSPPRCLTWNGSWRRIPPTTFIAPPDCWPTPTPTPASPKKADALFQAGHENFHLVRDLLQLRLLSGLPAPQRRSPRLGAGKSWRRSPPCRDICAAGSDPGSARRMRC